MPEKDPTPRYPLEVRKEQVRRFVNGRKADHKDPPTLDEIGKEIGVSRQRVKQILIEMKKQGITIKTGGRVRQKSETKEQLNSVLSHIHDIEDVGHSPTRSEIGEAHGLSNNQVSNALSRLRKRSSLDKDWRPHFDFPASKYETEIRDFVYDEMDEDSHPPSPSEIVAGLGVPYSSARTVLAEMVMSRNVAPPEKPISKGDSPERRLRIAKVVRELQQGLERNPEIREVVMALNMPGETKQVKYWVEAAILAGEIESYWD